MAEENKPTQSTPVAPIQDEKPEQRTQAQPKATKKYFRSPVAGLSIQVGEVNPENPVAPEVVRFVPYYEKFQGDRVRVGYLETDDKRALKVLESDGNVQEISAKEFKEATGKGSEPAGY